MNDDTRAKQYWESLLDGINLNRSVPNSTYDGMYLRRFVRQRLHLTTSTTSTRFRKKLQHPLTFIELLSTNVGILIETSF